MTRGLFLRGKSYSHNLPAGSSLVGPEDLFDDAQDRVQRGLNQYGQPSAPPPPHPYWALTVPW